MNEQNQPNPTRRRRRRPRRPKWANNKFTYQLWRNWPLIRFILICVILLGILCGMISCAVNAIGGLFTKDPAESQPVDTQPIETAVPPETEPQPPALVIDAENNGRILVAYYKDNAPASDSVYKSAESFRKLIQGKTELTVRVTRVRETSDNHAVTFLIGETPYEETAAVKASLPENSYAVQVMGRKIIIIG